MTWNVPWPHDDSEILAWSQALLVWAVANYSLGGDPVGRLGHAGIDRNQERHWKRLVLGRSLGAAAAIALIPGWTTARLPARLAFALVTLGLALLMPGLRLRMARSQTASKYLAEWEVAGSLMFAITSALIVAGWGLGVTSPVVRLPLATGRVAVACLWVSALVFAARGGTHVVRGLLDKAGSLPLLRSRPEALDSPSTPAGETGSAVDLPEFNRGRVIGNTERFLLIVMVAAGSYEALGFLVAAKGLIRAREFEDRDFAEYFIVGSLASIVVALLLGLLLRHAGGALWGR